MHWGGGWYSLNYPELQALESTLTGAEKDEARRGDTRPVLSYASYLQVHATRAIFFTWILKSLNFPGTGPA